MSARFVVMVSGGGTNLQALIDAISQGVVDARIVLVVSSRPDAYALERAKLNGLDTLVALRQTQESEIADSIAPFKPDYILLLGWMRILSDAFIDRFPGCIVNLHPALPGTFPGTRSIERAWEAHAKGIIQKTGVMMHYVPGAQVDAGPVIAFREVDFEAGEAYENFEARMHAAEHGLVVETASRLADVTAKGERR